MMTIARAAKGAAALSALVAAAGCASIEPAPAPTPVSAPAPAPVDPAIRSAVGAAYLAACFRTPLNLNGAEAPLLDQGFAALPPVENQRGYVKGDITVELRLGEQRPAVVSNCLVTTPSLNRDVSREIIKETVAASGLRYEARDLAALGDPKAHDVLGTAVGSDFWGVVMIIDRAETQGVGMLKTPARRE